MLVAETPPFVVQWTQPSSCQLFKETFPQLTTARRCYNLLPNIMWAEIVDANGQVVESKYGSDN